VEANVEGDSPERVGKVTLASEANSRPMLLIDRHYSGAQIPLQKPD